ncbi:MAG: GNAT family N-acetyltransferase [Holophagaceae bacterium]|nr:GNAT family N-acetyltransferase [Holophagaceae bacterium]
MKILETERLVLRPFILDDAEFIQRLLTDPSFLRYIGDKGVRTLEQATNYLLDGPIRSYGLHGHGLVCVEIRGIGRPIGMCGLLRRKPEQDPDLGYAFLPEFWGKGYASEAAAATLESGVLSHGFPRILALVSPGNVRSIHLLNKLGFRLAGSGPSHPGGLLDAIYEWRSADDQPGFIANA